MIMNLLLKANTSLYATIPWRIEKEGIKTYLGKRSMYRLPGCYQVEGSNFGEKINMLIHCIHVCW
jgi:hypothetical protein